MILQDTTRYNKIPQVFFAIPQDTLTYNKMPQGKKGYIKGIYDIYKTLMIKT